ncbi:MAG: serine hydrolase [Verrucomicrobiota bacterium]
MQILIAEAVTNRSGHVELRRAGYRVGAEYFYPASSIKLCAAIAALQTIEQLQTQHQTGDLLEVPLDIAPLFPGDVAQTNDASNLNGGFITIGQEIRKICLVSDNQAFNRFYDLTGHEALNRKMHALGLRSVVLNHRLSETRAIPDMLASAAVTFHLSNREPIIVPPQRSPLLLTNTAKDLFLGTGYLKDDALVNEPMDFSRRNGISLVDLQDLLVKLVRPDIELGTPKLELSPAHRAMMLEAMSLYPGESANPVYSPERYPGIRSKFLIPGIRRVFPAEKRGERIEVTGKTGRAYGFSIENSYVRNPANGCTVFVTAVLYTNSDGVLNDDKYDYETVADPFLADLGEWVARRYLQN